jgi:hypothetical protein
LAGLGRKIFNSGDILLASEVQGYLQDQAVMVFDDSATRATAIGTANFSEGMVTYTKDDDAIQVYDGSNFVGVGSDSGLIHIETQTGTGVTAISFNDVFTTDFSVYKIIVDANVASGNIRLRASGVDNSSSNYTRQQLEANDTVVDGIRTTISHIPAFLSHIGDLSGQCEIFYPAHTSNTQFITQHSGTSGGIRFYQHYGHLTVTTAYDGFTILFGSSCNAKVSVLGYKL